MRPEDLTEASGPLGSSSVRKLLKQVGQLDALEDARLAASGGGLKSLMPGIKPQSATAMARRAIKAWRVFGEVHKLDVAYELHDNAVLQLHAQGKSGRIAESLKIPLQFGFKVRRPFREFAGAWDYSYWAEGAQTKVASMWKQPEFIARGVFARGAGGDYQAMGLGEYAVGRLEQELEGIGTTDVARRIRGLQPTVDDIYKRAIFGTSFGPFEVGVPLESPGSILQAGQLQVLSERGKPLAETFKGGKNFPIEIGKGGGFRRERAYAHLLRMRKLGVLRTAGLSDLALKAETGMQSFVTGFAHGHITPFGKYADPTRQTYQRWDLMPLVGRPAPISLTTKAFEAAVKTVSPAGAPLGFQLPTKMFLTADPRVERAVAASQGGLIVSERAREALTYTAAGEKRIPRVGSALIAGSGGKYTVSAFADLGDDIGAVASSNIMRKGKHPESLRRLIVSDILSQVGTVKPGGPLEKAKLDFLTKLSTEIGGRLTGRQRSKYGKHGYPQIQLGPEADLDLARVESLVKSYNQQSAALGGQPITTGIGRTSLHIGGSGGVISDVMGYAVPDWIGVRAGQELDVINYAMGKGPAIKGLEDVGLTYSPVYGKGMKVRLKDIANIGMYGTDASDTLAQILTTAVEQADLGAKQDIYKTFVPVLGGRSVAGGIKLSTLQDAHPFVSLPEATMPGGGYTARELTGTIFDPAHRFSEGFTLNLDPKEAIRVPGLHGDVWTTQVHMPGMASLGWLPERKVVAGVEHELFHISTAQRSVYRAYRAAVTDPGAFRDEVVTAIDDIARVWGGRQGILRKSIEPRMGHSGYFRLVGMGEGKAAAALGTEMKAVRLATGETMHQAATVLISEVDVRSLGLYKQFQRADVSPAGTMFGLLTAYPAQSHAHNRAVLYKMVGKAEAERLGPGGLGLHQAMSNQMLRDFDADNTGALFLSARRGQQAVRAMALKHTVPEISAQAEIMDKLLEAELKGRADPASLKYKELMAYADNTVSAAAHKAEYTTALRMEQHYGVKAMTGPLNWWSNRMRVFTDAAANKKHAEAAGALRSAIEQAGAITKGVGTADEAATFVNFASEMSLEFLETGVLQKQERAGLIGAARELHRLARASGEGILATYGDSQMAKLDSGALLLAQSARTWRKAAEDKKAYPKTLATMTSRAWDADHPTRSALQAISADGETLVKGIEAEHAAIARAGGLSQISGLLDVDPHVKAPGVAASNLALKESGTLGKELPAPLLEKLIDWFRRPATEVPHYKKAAVIGAGVILGGAVLKNLLMPGFAPSDAMDMPASHVAVPIPVRMPNAEQAQMPGIFGRLPPGQVTESAFSVQPSAGFGTRTPLPAVQVGAGILGGGGTPPVMGSPFREPAPAPAIMGQEPHREVPGSPMPPTAHVEMPREPVRGVRMEARAPQGFDIRDLTRGMSQMDIQVMIEEDESELAIQRALAENEYSAYS